MLLSTAHAYGLFAKHGAFAREVCDRCSQLLGAVRFTRRGELGVWCSRECRDGVDGHKPGACRHCKAKLPEGKRRGALYCDDACKEAAHRSVTAAQTSRTPKLSVTKPSIYAAFSSRKLPVGISGHPGAFGALTA